MSMGNAAGLKGEKGSSSRVGIGTNEDYSERRVRVRLECMEDLWGKAVRKG